MSRVNCDKLPPSSGFTGENWHRDGPLSGHHGFSGVGKVLIPNPIFGLFNGILGFGLQRPGEIEFGRVTIDKKDGRKGTLQSREVGVKSRRCPAQVAGKSDMGIPGKSQFKRRFTAAVMKALFGAVAMTVGSSFIAITATAQNFAPSSLASRLLEVTIQSGSAPFTSDGDYKIITSPLGGNFVILGSVEAGLNWGLIHYETTGTNRGAVALLDAKSGLNTSFSLVFFFALRRAGSPGPIRARRDFKPRRSKSRITRRWPRPNFFSPITQTGCSKRSIAGQVGAICAVAASSDLLNWSPLASQALTSLTSLFTDTNAAGFAARFYRVQVVSVDYAPGSIDGQSLNFAVAEGATPLATNGFFQFSADASDTNYQMISGAGMTTTEGTYQYRKIATSAGLITSVDSQNTTQYFSLAFTTPTSGFYYATAAGSDGFQAGSFTMAEGPVVYLGNYHFTPDPSRSASVTFPANTNPAALSVTDAAGNVWTLSLPADALLLPQTITMTPAASVDSSDAALPALAGVLLDPDGIQFCDGVTLTLSVPAPLGTNACLMNVEVDGSEVRLVAATNQGNSYSTTLFHFSSVVISDPTSQQLQPLGTVTASLIAALNEAQTLATALEAHLAPPPPPPGYNWPCDPAARAQAGAAANAYQADVFSAENEVIGRLLAAKKALDLLGDASLDSQATASVGQLFTMDIFPRLRMLINGYGGNPTNVYPVSLVTLGVVKQAQLLEVAASADLLTSVIADVNKAGRYYLNNLRTTHDYSMEKVIGNVAAVLLQLGGDPSPLLALVGGALKFQLTMDIMVNTESYVQGALSGSTAEEASGQFPISLASVTNLQGSGTCQYLSGVITAYPVSGFSGFSASLVPGQSFAENCILVLNACPGETAPTAMFTFPNGFGSRSETYQCPQGPLVSNQLLGTSSYVFEDDDGGAGFSFLVPLQNGNAQAVNTTISEQRTLGVANESSTLQLILQHTP